MSKFCKICGSNDFKINSDEFCSMRCIHLHGIKRSNEKVECEYCDKKIIKRNYTQHIKKHIREKEKEEILSKTLFKCEYCGKEFYGKTKNTNRFCCKKCSHAFSTKNTRKEISATIKQKLLNGEKIGYCKINFNNYIIKDNGEKIKLEYFCSKCGKKIGKTKYNLCSKCVQSCDQYRKNVSNGLSKALKGKSGGYRKNSGRGKCGWYKGYWCQSSYELAWVIYSLDHNVKFERNKDEFVYFFKDEKHNYLPDFKISDKEYTEIKGYINEQWKSKMQQFPKYLKLNVLYRKDMKLIIKYVEQKYGKDFIELYEGNPYKTKTNKCKVCGNECHNEYCSQKCSGIAAARRNHKKIC